MKIIPDNILDIVLPGLSKRQRTVLLLFKENVRSVVGARALNISVPTYLKKINIIKRYCNFKCNYVTSMEKLDTEARKLLTGKNRSIRKKSLYYRIYKSLCEHPLRNASWHSKQLKMKLATFSFAVHYITKRLRIGGSNKMKKHITLLLGMLFDMDRTEKYGNKDK